MVLKNILQPEIQLFLHDHEDDDVKALVLKHKEILGLPASVVAEQLSGRKKAKDKLPTWYRTPNIVYPPTLNLEQCSSEVTANYKAKILAEGSLDSMVDLTGGFGVDTMAFSKFFKEVYYIEPNEDLFEIARHNFKTLGRKIISQNTTAESFVFSHLPARNIGRSKEAFDALFIDPSRRKSTQRVYKLADCEPNIISLQPKLFALAYRILVKTSPLLDIHQGLSELKHVSRVYAVAVKNEVKELLFHCEKDFDQEPTIHAINLVDENNPHVFSFLLRDEKEVLIGYGDPLGYLYEPNAAIQKTGAFKSIASTYGLTKIHPNTHLYTSDEIVLNFPGRTFRIEALVKPDKNELQKHFPEGKANITTRNYPLTPEALKKKTGIKDGGEKFLIGFSGEKRKFLVVGERV